MTTPADRIELEVYVPAARLVKTDVRKISAEGAHGAFTLLPRHIDMVTTLAPGLLFYVDDAGGERVIGIDEGTLVKCGATVRVAVLDAVEGDDLATLRDQVARRFLALDDSERAARTALARLEAGAIRGMMEFER